MRWIVSVLLLVLAAMAGLWFYRTSAHGVAAACLAHHAPTFLDPQSAYVVASANATYTSTLNGRTIDVSARTAGGGVARSQHVCVVGRYGFDALGTDQLLARIANDATEVTLARRDLDRLEEEKRVLDLVEERANEALNCYETVYTRDKDSQDIDYDQLTAESCEAELNERLFAASVNFRKCGPSRTKVMPTEYCRYRFVSIPALPDAQMKAGRAAYLAREKLDALEAARIAPAPP